MALPFLPREVWPSSTSLLFNHALRIPGGREVTKKFVLSACLLMIPLALSAGVVENFDDINTLAGSGWVMTNNSSPIGTTGWFQGNTAVFDAQAGPPDAYIAANFNNAAFGGNISNWLMTPVLDLS